MYLRSASGLVLVALLLAGCGGSGGGGSTTPAAVPALHEVVLYHPSGAVKERGMADASNRRQGAWQRWYASGATEWQGTYRDDAIVDAWRLWNEDGSVRDDAADATGGG